MVTVTSGDGANTVIAPDVSGISLTHASSHGARNDIGKAPAAPVDVALQHRTIAPSEDGVGEIVDSFILAEVL